MRRGIRQSLVRVSVPLDLGKSGEEVARRFLENRGYVILSANFRCRGGEVDIVALDNKTLVFVEVKTRRGALPGAALEQITRRKQRRIIHAAKVYLKSLLECNPGGDYPACRFDAVAVTFDASGSLTGIELVKGAFFGGDGLGC